MQDIEIGDKVLVAERSKQTYRPDLVVVTVKDIKITENRTTYFLSDGTSVVNKKKIYKIEDAVKETSKQQKIIEDLQGTINRYLSRQAQSN